jgi:hypothetical protein
MTHHRGFSSLAASSAKTNLIFAGKQGGAHYKVLNATAFKDFIAFSPVNYQARQITIGQEVSRCFRYYQSLERTA